MYTKRKNGKKFNNQPKLIAVSTVANSLSGIEYKNDKENEANIKMGNRAHLKATLHSDIVGFAIFVLFVLLAICVVLTQHF